MPTFNCVAFVGARFTVSVSIGLQNVQGVIVAPSAIQETYYLHAGELVRVSGDLSRTPRLNRARRLLRSMMRRAARERYKDALGVSWWGPSPLHPHVIRANARALALLQQIGNRVGDAAGRECRYGARYGVDGAADVMDRWDAFEREAA